MTTPSKNALMRLFPAKRAARALICAVLCALPGALGARGAPERAALDPMKMIFFPSAACFFFPDGGTMLIDIGKGTSEAVIEEINRHVYEGRRLYRLFAVLGWRPRIDWLVVTSRGNVWDYEFVQTLNSFDILRLYFPFDTRKETAGARGIGRGSMRMLLQISFSGYPVLDLSGRKTIGLAQSVSGVRVHKLLPLPGPVSEGEGRASVCLLFVYNRVRVLVSSELTQAQQDYLLQNDPGALRADVFFCPPGLTAAFMEAVGAPAVVPYDGPVTIFTTDGNTLKREEN